MTNRKPSQRESSQRTRPEISRSNRRPKTNPDLPAILFDLDGTLIDSVYEHVAAWSIALRSIDIVLPNWKIHRHIGMSGGSFVRELLREASHKKRNPNIDALEEKHDREFTRMRLEILPGSQELLDHLEKSRVSWAIATTSGKTQTKRLLKHFRIPSHIPVVNGDDVKNAKPSPDIFVKAAQELGVAIGDCIVIGDSVWDVLAAGRKSALGVGLLSGGYSQEELERAGAFRVYADPADLLIHIEDLGIPGA